ncbi:flagellar hook-associated protein 2 [Lysobacter xinjiangensis]|uniref:Flagellar hook-associated protein 2 n=1 Tax=Cognatilysobacter xinjiangensis TaxID=546892 RepID=A0ABQ3BNX7_9GAMM|nr:flagellar filament capping protein FliD [Lysobacter xinjiangensis]GGZ52886.1 flagellar hook-associated protein 2 [Lysobacter xinjiangensis]
MASISTGSSIDVNTLVSQLVAAERAPTDKRFSAIETTTKAQISAFGQLTSALSSLDSTIKRFDGDGALPGRKATVAADAGYTASAGATARLGSYSISVERLATAQKLQSAPLAKDTQLGHGRISIQVADGDAIDIDIAEGKGTLAQIRDAINAKSADNGFTATIVHGDAGDVLMLSATKTGTAGKLTVTTSGGDGGLGKLASSGGTMTEVVAANDAKVIVDGVVRTSSSNTITDGLDGVSLTLTKANPGTTFALDVASDASTLKASLLTLVSTYNTAMTQMRSLGQAGTDGKTAGTLVGDAMPRNIMQSLRSMVSASYGDLSKLGFKTAVDGSLSLDGAKFDAAIAADPNAISKLFGNEAPLGKQMRSLTANYVGTDNAIGSRTESLNKKLKDLTRQRDNYEVRIEKLTAQYRTQFTALDSLLSKLSSTSSYLSQQLSALSSSSS